MVKGGRKTFSSKKKGRIAGQKWAEKFKGHAQPGSTALVSAGESRPSLASYNENCFLPSHTSLLLN
jgi:hypothetical protein